MRTVIQAAALAGVVSMAPAAWGQNLFWEDHQGPPSQSIAGGAGLFKGQCAVGDTCYVWTITKNNNGIQGNTIETFDGVRWSVVPGAAEYITNDQVGRPWVINGGHAIYYWNGSAFALWNAGTFAAELAVGDPTKPYDIWMVDIFGNVYVNSGTLSSPGSWINVPAPFATAISLSRGRIEICFPNDVGAATRVHIPFISTAGHIFVGYQDEDTQDCSSGIFWVDTGGAAAPGNQTLGPEITVGTDHNLYGWRWNTISWQFIMAGPPGGLFSVNSEPTTGTWGLDANGTPLLLLEVLGSSGFGYNWNPNL